MSEELAPKTPNSAGIAARDPKPLSARDQALKFAFEFGPLICFFAANWFYGIFWATAVLMVATVVALAFSHFLLGRTPLLPLMSGAFVLVFGGLTLFLHDDFFIKIKLTIFNVLLAVVLLGGLMLGRPLLKYAFADLFRLTDEGWRKLTLRWAVFFLFLAVLNEIVWRGFPDLWVSFKTFGIIPITMTFALAQMGLVTRYERPEQEIG